MPDEPWAVSADATQLHQVLMNLCVNARDAMPDGGKLTLTLGNFVVDDVFAGMNVDAQPGPYVVFQVEDTGHGMLPEVRERIFEPFFSTKEVGEGTGLGLSTSFSIVRGHGGFMNIYSEPRKGTRFKVYLPAEADAVVIEERAVEQTRLPRGNGELILIVDDEEDVRKITKKALERFGYRVLLASNGAEAVSVFVKNQDEVAVVLTDMSMPVMDGPALIVALKSISPGVRIIASSGLPANGNVTKAVSAGIEHFVAKPYTAKTLLNTLRTILGPDTEPTPPEKESRRPEPRPQSEDQPRKPKERSGETILVVDDQESLLRLCRTLLERAGYTVRTACSAAEALSVLAQSKVDLAVVDLNMPGKGGLELVREMQEEYPEVKVLFVSGSNSEVTTRNGHTLLPKPYSPAQLTENVRTLLSSD